MKKKSPSQSAFLNLRVLIGLAVFLSGVCLALAGLGTFSKSNAPSQSKRSTKAPAAKSAAHTSFSHSLGTRHVEYSPADKDGRFRYMIQFAEKGMLQRQTRVQRPAFPGQCAASADAARAGDEGTSQSYSGHESSTAPRIKCLALFSSDA